MERSPVTLEDRHIAEAAAERCLRRGDFTGAIALLQQVLDASPGDAALAARIATLTENLSPSERRAAPRAPAIPSPPQAPTSEAEDAEQRAARGDFDQAIAIYRRLLSTQPDNELLQERLSELFRLAQARAPRDLPRTTSAEAVLSDLLSRISARKRS